MDAVEVVAMEPRKRVLQLELLVVDVDSLTFRGSLP